MKKEKQPKIISLAILTLITSVLWIFFSLYRVFTEKTELKVPEEILTPLSPNLNEKIISEIENRVFIEENQIPDSVIKQVFETEIAEPASSPEINEVEETETESTDSAELEEVEL